MPWKSGDAFSACFTAFYVSRILSFLVTFFHGGYYNCYVYNYKTWKNPLARNLKMISSFLDQLWVVANHINDGYFLECQQRSRTPVMNFIHRWRKWIITKAITFPLGVTKHWGCAGTSLNVVKEHLNHSGRILTSAFHKDPHCSLKLWKHTSHKTNIFCIYEMQKFTISRTCLIKQVYLRVDRCKHQFLMDWSVFAHTVSLCCLGTGDKHPPLLCLIPYLLERASLEQLSLTAALFISTLTDRTQSCWHESTFRHKRLHFCLPAADIPGQLWCERKLVFVFRFWAIFRN